MQQNLKPDIKEISTIEKPNVEKIVGTDIVQNQVVEPQQIEQEDKFAKYGLNFNDIINKAKSDIHIQQPSLPKQQSNIINTGGLLVSDTSHSDSDTWKYFTYLLPILALLSK